MSGVKNSVRVQEHCDEWLTTRNKRKISPPSSLSKRRRSTVRRPLTSTTSSTYYRLTQNSPPSAEVFINTKQTSILKFFQNNAVDIADGKPSDGAGVAETVYVKDNDAAVENVENEERLETDLRESLHATNVHNQLHSFPCQPRLSPSKYSSYDNEIACDGDDDDDGFFMDRNLPKKRSAKMVNYVHGSATGDSSVENRHSVGTWLPEIGNHVTGTSQKLSHHFDTMSDSSTLHSPSLSTDSFSENLVEERRPPACVEKISRSSMKETLSLNSKNFSYDSSPKERGFSEFESLMEKESWDYFNQENRLKGKEITEFLNNDTDNPFTLAILYEDSELNRSGEATAAGKRENNRLSEQYTVIVGMDYSETQKYSFEEDVALVTDNKFKAGVSIEIDDDFILDSQNLDEFDSE